MSICHFIVTNICANYTISFNLKYGESTLIHVYLPINGNLTTAVSVYWNDVAISLQLLLVVGRGQVFHPTRRISVDSIVKKVFTFINYSLINFFFSEGIRVNVSIMSKQPSFVRKFFMLPAYNKYPMYHYLYMCEKSK